MWRRGTRSFQGKKLILELWTPEVGWVQNQKVGREGWVRAVDLPLQFWQEEVIRKIGNCCGGFVQVDRDTTNFSKIQWTRLRVKRVGKILPGTLQLIVENLCVELQFWWEVLPWMSHVLKRVAKGDL